MPGNSTQDNKQLTTETKTSELPKDIETIEETTDISKTNEFLIFPNPTVEAPIEEVAVVENCPEVSPEQPGTSGLLPEVHRPSVSHLYKTQKNFRFRMKTSKKSSRVTQVQVIQF